MKARYLQSTFTHKESALLSRIVVLTGARQTGKTTLVRQCFPEYTYLSIEDPVMRVQYAQMTASQWNTYFPNAILDEVQKEPRLIESIKSVYDQFPDSRYILLGSSQLRLLQKVRESLAGRCVVHEVYPLTIPEIRSQSWNDPPKPSLFQQWVSSGSVTETMPSFRLLSDFATRQSAYQYFLQYGGYPALVDDGLNDDDRFSWLSGYIRTYLERDLRDLAEIASLEPFVKLQQVSANLTGQLVNYSELARSCGISPKTAQRFMNYLEISYQSIQLQPWYRNPLKRLVKTPKLHYLDPGVQKTILRKRGELTGHEFESAIVAEMFKQTRAIGLDLPFYHLRTLDGREIDLLIETENGYFAFEIKMSDHTSSSHSRHFMAIAPILDKPLLHGFVLSNDPAVLQSSGITCIPAAMFLT